MQWSGDLAGLKRQGQIMSSKFLQQHHCPLDASARMIHPSAGTQKLSCLTVFNLQWELVSRTTTSVVSALSLATRPGASSGGTAQKWSLDPVRYCIFLTCQLILCGLGARTRHYYYTDLDLHSSWWMFTPFHNLISIYMYLLLLHPFFQSKNSTNSITSVQKFNVESNTYSLFFSVG